VKDLIFWGKEEEISNQRGRQISFDGSSPGLSEGLRQLPFLLSFDGGY